MKIRTVFLLSCAAALLAAEFPAVPLGGALWAQEPASPAEATLEADQIKVKFDEAVNTVNLSLDVDVEPTAWLGIEASPVSDTLRAQLGLPAGEGLVVTSVQADSPAAEAGLEVHDVLATFADAPLTDNASLEAKIKEHSEKPATIAFWRAGKRLRVDATPKLLHVSAVFQPIQRFVVNDLAEQNQYWIGVETGAVEDTLRAQLKLPADRGVVIVKVIDDTPASKAGLQAHDVLVTINDEPVASVDDVPPKIQALGGAAGKFQVVRAGDVQVIEIAPVPRAPQPEIQSLHRAYFDLGRDEVLSGLLLNNQQALVQRSLIDYHPHSLLHSLSANGANANCMACHQLPESCRAASLFTLAYKLQSQPSAAGGESPPTDLTQIQAKLGELQQSADRQSQVLREVTESLGKLEQKFSSESAAELDQRQKALDDVVLRVHELLEQFKTQVADPEKK